MGDDNWKREEEERTAGSYSGHGHAEPLSSLQELVEFSGDSKDEEQAPVAELAGEAHDVPSTSRTASTFEIMKPCEDDFMLLYDTIERKMSYDEDIMVNLEEKIMRCRGTFCGNSFCDVVSTIVSVLQET